MKKKETIGFREIYLGAEALVVRFFVFLSGLVLKKNTAVAGFLLLSFFVIILHINSKNTVSSLSTVVMYMLLFAVVSASIWLSSSHEDTIKKAIKKWSPWAVRFSIVLLITWGSMAINREMSLRKDIDNYCHQLNSSDTWTYSPYHGICSQDRDSRYSNPYLRELIKRKMKNDD